MPPKKRLVATPRMGEERVAFLQCVVGTMSIYMNDPAANAQDETPSVTLYLSEGVGKPPFRIGLASLTEEELDLFEEFILMALKMARPVVQVRDRIAREAFEDGDDSFSRIYRQQPKLIVRPKKHKPNDEGSLHDQLVTILEQSDHVLLNPNEFRNKRTEMDFWVSDDDLEMPL